MIVVARRRSLPCKRNGVWVRFPLKEDGIFNFFRSFIRHFFRSGTTWIQCQVNCIHHMYTWPIKILLIKLSSNYVQLKTFSSFCVELEQSSILTSFHIYNSSMITF